MLKLLNVEIINYVEAQIVNIIVFDEGCHSNVIEKSFSVKYQLYYLFHKFVYNL